MRRFTEEKITEIKNRLGAENVFENEPLAPYMSMKVGGPADYLFTPQSVEDIAYLIGQLKEADIAYYVVGNGSNIIVRDKGYEGAIIRLLENFNDVKIEGNIVAAQAGVKLKELADQILEASLTGFEFASGIPGSLGGALTMNAGAYDGEMKDVTKTITVLSKDGDIQTFTKEQAQMTYRHTVFSDGDYVILSAELELEPGDKSEIKARMDDLEQRRADKQPLEYPSCGSTFKRPEGYFAGKLIMDSGLKGARVGGASVSEKHCGFVINDKYGTAQDVLDVIDLVKKTVKEKQGVELECEIRIL